MRIIIIAIIFSFLPITVKAANNKMVILPFHGDDKSLNIEIPEILTACLTDYSDNVYVLERRDSIKFIGELGLHMDHSLKNNNIPALGRMYQAGLLLKGSYFITDDIINIQASLYHTETNILAGMMIDKLPLLEFIMSCGVIDSQIADLVNNISSPKIHEIDKNPQLTEYYLRGISEFHSGKYAKAITSFTKIIRKDKKHLNARFWLARSYYELDMKDSSYAEFKILLNEKDYKQIGTVKSYIEILEK